ncbi:MAG: HEAT repeat domain-containing protein [Polyangiaceae bacterium]|nr:HEAT repeat domain-containing protein [Polyangiaceae bacterium]
MRRLAIALLVLAVSGSAAAGSWPTDEARVALLLASDAPATRIEGLGRLRALSRAAALPLLTKALDDADVDVRLAAADAAVALRAPEASTRAVGWLSDQDVRLRLAGCRVLARTPSRDALPSLGRALGDSDARVRQAAASALGQSRAAEAVPLLLGRLDDALPETRLAVVQALRRLGDPRAAPPLLSRVQDGSPEVRKVVLRALSELGGASAAAAVAVGLRDPLPEVRIEALGALARFADPELELQVIPLLSHDQPREVRRAALGTLAAAGTPRALDALFAVFADDEAMRPAIRVALATAATRAHAELERRLGEAPAGPVASAIAEALGASRDASAARAVAAALARGKVAPLTALEALAALAAPDGLIPALAHLDHESEAVRRAARAACRAVLSRGSSGRAVEPVLAALDRGGLAPREEIELLQLLGLTGSPRATPALLDRARVGHLARRRAALEALAAVGDPSAEGPLLAALGDPDPDVRSRAGLALARGAGPETAAKLVDALLSQPTQDRPAIALALPSALARAASGAPLTRLMASLDALDPAARDAAIEGAGRAPGGAGEAALLSLARSSAIADRRKVAEALGATEPARAALRVLAGDADPGVRASAVWSLGGSAADVASLRAALDDPSELVAANAAASLARSLAASSPPDTSALCAAAGGSRARVAAAALGGLARLRGRCGDGELERRALAEAESATVRAAAASAIAASPAHPADAAALERCRRDDPVGAVARACAAPPGASAGADPVSVVVLAPDGASPAPRAPFSLLLADGAVRYGFADRRGMVFDRAAPRGALRLLASPLGPTP